MIRALRRWAPIAVVYAGVLLAVFPAVWAPGVERRLFGWDALDSYWPDLVFQIEAWRDGEPPLWNPYERGGYPFYADPQPAQWSPLTWLVVGLGLATGQTGPWLVQLKVMLHLFLAGVTMHLFLRSGRKLSSAACFFGGLSFLLSGPLIFHKSGALLWPWALAPVGLLAVEHFVRRGSHAAGALLGAAFALPIVSGFPPSAFYFALVGAPYLGARLLETPPEKRRLAPLGTALATLAALASPVIVPAVLHLPLLARGERTLAYATDSPLPWRELAGFLLPWASRHGVYAGLLPVAGTVLALAVRRDKALLALAAAGTFGLVLALGAQTPVLPFLAEHVEPFGLFRIAYRYRVIPCLALCVIGAHGVDPLLARVRGRWRTGVGLLLPAVAALDLRIAHADRLALLERPQPHPNARETALLDSDSGRSFRIFDEWQLYDRAGSRLGLRDLRGRSRDPTSLRRYQDVMEELSARPRLLAVFGVRDYLFGAQDRSSRRLAWIRDPRRHRVLRRGGDDVFTLAAWPQLFWAAGTNRAADGAATLELLADAVEPIAVVDPGDLPEGLAGPETSAGPGFVEGTVTLFSRNHVTAEIEVPGPGLVVLNEVFTPDWTVSIDGVQAPLFRANHMMRGVYVEPGRHVLDFRFRPVALYVTGALFFLGLLGVALASLREARGRAPAPDEPNPPPPPRAPRPAKARASRG